MYFRASKIHIVQRKGKKQLQHIIFIGVFMPCVAKAPSKTSIDRLTEAYFRGSIIKTQLSQSIKNSYFVKKR
jgi:hypothetical protein